MIGIVGAGAFGTALATTLGAEGRCVILWSRAPFGRDIPGATATPNLSDLAGASAILLAIPTQSLRSFMAAHGAALDGHPLVACCKGIDLDTLQGPTALIRDACAAATPAILTGPGFATDIVRGLPTALTLACADDAMGARLQSLLSAPALRLYRSTDVTGAELGGALKNIIAIACGACIGAGLGESTRAALMTRGFAEMQRLALRLGARPATLMGLSGFGDLVLTCTSEHSRNYRFGLALGRGEGFDPAVTVEGVATARAVARLAVDLDVEMPITAALTQLFDGKSGVSDAIRSLLTRPLKEE
jgi:glycerol-3-phosphate dehydrogenase (NAD(P)+)